MICFRFSCRIVLGLFLLQGPFLISCFSMEKNNRYMIIDDYNPQEHAKKNTMPTPSFNPEYVQSFNELAPWSKPNYIPKPYNPNLTISEFTQQKNAFALLPEEKKNFEENINQMQQKNHSFLFSSPHQTQDKKKDTKEKDDEELKSMMRIFLQSQAQTQEKIEQNSQAVEKIHLKIEKNLHKENVNIYKFLKLTTLGLQKIITLPLKGMQSVFFGCLTYSWAVKVSVSLSPFIGVPASLPLVVGVVATGLDYFILD